MVTSGRNLRKEEHKKTFDDDDSARAVGLLRGALSLLLFKSGPEYNGERVGGEKLLSAKRNENV